MPASKVAETLLAVSRLRMAVGRWSISTGVLLLIMHHTRRFRVSWNAGGLLAKWIGFLLLVALSAIGKRCQGSSPNTEMCSAEVVSSTSTSRRTSVSG